MIYGLTHYCNDYKLVQSNPVCDNILYPSPSPVPYQNISCDLTVIYNDTATHSIPVIINAVTTALGTMSVGTPSIPMVTSSQSWPSVSPTPGFDGSLFGGTILLGMSLITTPASMAALLVKEKQVSDTDVQCLRNYSHSSHMLPICLARTGGHTSDSLGCD